MCNLGQEGGRREHFQAEGTVRVKDTQEPNGPRGHGGRAEQVGEWVSHQISHINDE